MYIEKLTVGPFMANCYIIIDKGNNKSIIIDPGGDKDKIFDFIKDKEVEVSYLLLTHGHIDHIEACDYLKEKTGGQIIIHSEDSKVLRDPVYNLSSMDMYPGSAVTLEADIEVEDREIVKTIGFDIEFLHTPGHTPGSMVIRVEDALFTGDTLFSGGIGRTDLPGGSGETLIKSLRKLSELEKEIKNVYPGHGSLTTLEQERISNPFFDNK